MDGDQSKYPPAAACPVCRKPTQLGFHPFCSKRCADVDLGRWFGERYRVETNDKPAEAGLKDEGQTDEISRLDKPKQT